MNHAIFVLGNICLPYARQIVASIGRTASSHLLLHQKTKEKIRTMETSRQPTSPACWKKSAAQNQWWSRVEAARETVLMLDYDGTLAPFEVDRMRALPYRGIEERLEQLAQINTTSIVLVSGRPASELRTIFPFAKQVEIWASHGREHMSAAGEYVLFDLTAEQSSLLASVEADLAAASLPPSALERKPASLAIHWRGLEPEEQETIRDRVLNRYHPLSQNDAIELMPFEDGVEVRATGRTKADAVRAVLASRSPATPVAYLGDDRTDEDAFAAMPPDDLALLVRRVPRATFADYWLSPPEELLEFLDQWIATVARSQAQPARSAGSEA
jgi:trehalose-phosphatase